MSVSEQFASARKRESLKVPEVLKDLLVETGEVNGGLILSQKYWNDAILESYKRGYECGKKAGEK